MQNKTRKSSNGQSKGNTKVNKRTSSSSSAGKSGSKFTNDPSWYGVDSSILRDAASLPYSIPAGAPFNLGGVKTSVNSYIPGVMAYELAPTIGYADSVTDPVNMAAAQSYSFIRHANSGSANYDSSDIMLYFLAMADVYSYIEYLKRMYGVVQVYAQRNKYIPYTLLQAMKVDPQSLINNLANFRLGVNMLINKAASFAVPNTMSLFPRRQFLYAGVYTEGSSIRDQLYLYTPNGFHVYNWQEGKTNYMKLSRSAIQNILGIECKVMGGGFDAMDLVAIGHRMIDVIINNEDLGIMNGDILKAYGDNILKLSHLGEDYAIAPVYDPAVLEQMQNASIIPCFGNGSSAMLATQMPNDSLDIISYYVDDGGTDTGIPILLSRPSFQDMTEKLLSDEWTDSIVTNTDNVMNLMHAGSHMLTTQLTDPEAKDNMELTRLMACLIKRKVKVETGEFEVWGLSSGTEVCTGCYVFHKPYLGNGEENLVAVYQAAWEPSYIDATTWKNISGFAWNAEILRSLQEPDYMRLISAFKFRPAVYYFDFLKAVESWKDYKALSEGSTFVNGQLSNYTVINTEVCDKLHHAAIMSEFATPHVAIKSV